MVTLTLCNQNAQEDHHQVGPPLTQRNEFSKTKIATLAQTPQNATATTVTASQGQVHHDGQLKKTANTALMLSS